MNDPSLRKLVATCALVLTIAGFVGTREITIASGGMTSWSWLVSFATGAMAYFTVHILDRKDTP